MLKKISNHFGVDLRFETQVFLAAFPSKPVQYICSSSNGNHYLVVIAITSLHSLHLNSLIEVFSLKETLQAGDDKAALLSFGEVDSHLFAVFSFAGCTPESFSADILENAISEVIFPSAQEIVPTIKEVSLRANIAVNEVEPDHIWNRFDIIYNDNYSLLLVKEWKDAFYVPLHIEKVTAYIGIWMTLLSYDALGAITKYIFRKYGQVIRVVFKGAWYSFRSRAMSNHFHINLPDTLEQLYAPMSAKSRYNIKRNKRIINDKIGAYSIERYTYPAIPQEIMDTYFQFKKQTHGTDYHMTNADYLDHYHVSDVYALKIGGKVYALLNSCEQGDAVYLENFTYDPQYSKYSLGSVLYDDYLRILIEKKKKQLCLGGEDYEYKKHYGSYETYLYNGVMYRNNLFWFLCNAYKKLTKIIKK